MRLFSAALALLSAWTFLIHNTCAQDASDLLKRAELHRGVCCVLGVGDGTLPLALAEHSEMLIHVRDHAARINGAWPFRCLTFSGLANLRYYHWY